VPRVKVTIPDELLQTAGNSAQKLDKSVDELFTEAIARYVEVTKNVTPGALRSRSGIPRSSPVLTVEIPEALFQSADKVAKRLGKRREVLYCEALARHLSHSSNASSAFDQGHDLPSGAWRPGATGEHAD
jgi:metal-responsive CopG/Arc/MetJ family transcriptional regulator